MQDWQGKRIITRTRRSKEESAFRLRALLCMLVSPLPGGFVARHRSGGIHMKRWIWFLAFGWIASSVFGAESVWYRVGPVAGDIRQIEPDRAHPGVWYVVESQERRLYRSIDNGVTWENTHQVNVRQLMVHSASSEVFITLPGRDYKIDLFSSTDLGQTFHLRCANAPDQVFAHPTDGKILWGSGVSNGYDLSVSYDRGEHWQNFTNMPYKLNKTYTIYGEDLPVDSYYLSSVLVSPLDSKTIYVSTEVDFYAGCSDETIDLELVSVNFGKTWAYAEVPASRYIYDPAFPDRALSVNHVETRILTQNGWKRLAPRSFDDIVSVPGKPGKLYALAYDKQWVSVDGGINWHSIDVGPAGKASVLQARTFPEGSLLVGTSGAGLYLIDETGSERQIINGFREASVSDVAMAPGSPVIFAVTSDTFLYRSLNSGKTWKNITDSLPTKPGRYGAIQVTVDQRNGRQVYVNVNETLVASFDAGETWTLLPLKHVGRVFFGPDSATTYFSKNNDSHLYRSSDGGRTLQQLPATFGSRGTSIFDLAVDRFNGYFYVATQRGLFLSRDEGRTSEQIAGDLSPDCPACLSFYEILALPLRGQYIALAEDSFYKTMNQGITWKLLTDGVGKIYVADDTGQHLYGINDRLWESLDGGQNWDSISASIDPRLGPRYYGSDITAMTDPRVRPLYVATSLGMFRTDK